MGRRTFVKGLGAAGAATVGLSSTATPAAAVDWSAVGMTAGSYALFGPAIAVGWALREFEVLGADAPAEGLTADALKQQVYSAAKKRKSDNASTFVDNQNILDGIEHTAYTDAKIAAIEQLNAGVSESEVLDAANNAVDSYFTTVESNLLKSWNATVDETETLVSSVESHADLSLASLAGTQNGGPDDTQTLDSPQFEEVQHTLPDGSTMSVREVYVTWSDGDNSHLSETMLSVVDPREPDRSNGGLPYSENYEFDSQHIFPWVIDGEPLGLLDSDPSIAGNWVSIFNSIATAYDNVSNGVSTWVTNVYGDVQSGDIEISDLVTPRERAAMMAEEEGMSQAIADLISLNIPVDPEREATITMSDTGATISGTFALTDSPDGPLETGQTYDTSNFSGDVYFTADMSLVEGDWSAYETGVDGGNITLTESPYDGTAVELETAANETVTVDSGNWTATGNGTWYYDASADLETDITEIVSARFLSTSTETQFETFQIQGTFTVDRLVNTQSGEEVTTTSFTNSEPQNDTNYITQDEWDQLEQQNQELIEKYENSQSGGGIDLGAFDMFGIPGEIVVIGAGALAALGVLSN